MAHNTIHTAQIARHRIYAAISELQVAQVYLNQDITLKPVNMEIETAIKQAEALVHILDSMIKYEANKQPGGTFFNGENKNGKDQRTRDAQMEAQTGRANSYQIRPRKPKHQDPLP